MRLLAGAATLAMAVQAAATQSGEVVRYADPPGLVLGVDADEVTPQNYNDGWADRAVLRSGEGGSYAVRVTLRTGDAREFGVLPRDYQIYVLDGELRVAGFLLQAGDFLRLPQGSDMGEVAGTAGTSYLLFADPIGRGAGLGEEPFLARGDAVEWRIGTVARDAGAEAPLQIKPLWTQEGTGARVHLVRIAPGVSVPWEIHPGVEEGYLIEGDYTLQECLPSGLQTHEYDPGGYFYRPGGVMHSGPKSRTTEGATWLIRTPVTLTALFYNSCPAPPPLEETTP